MSFEGPDTMHFGIHKRFSKNTCPGKIPKYDSRVLSDPTSYYKRDTRRAI